MKRILPALLWALSSVIFFSCAKEKSLENGIVPSGTGGSGGSGGTGGGTGGGNTNPNTYHPLTAGSYWKYKDSASGAFSMLTATNRTRTISNRLYSVITTTAGTQNDSLYAAVIGPDYFYYINTVSPNTGAPASLLFHYLNDTASIGYQWQYNAGSGNGYPATIRTEIVEKNITVTVAGHSFPNVYHTRLVLSYDMGTLMEFGTYDYYIARGVGIIRIRTDFSAMGFNTPACSDLVDYHIN